MLWWDLKRATKRTTRLRREIRKSHPGLPSSEGGSQNLWLPSNNSPSPGSAGYSLTNRNNRETECCGCFREELQTNQGEGSVQEREERGVWGQLGRQRALGVSCSYPFLHHLPLPLLPDRYKYVSAPRMWWNSIKNLSFSDNYKSSLQRKPSKLTRILLYLRVPLYLMAPKLLEWKIKNAKPHLRMH